MRLNVWHLSSLYKRDKNVFHQLLISYLTFQNFKSSFDVLGRMVTQIVYMFPYNVFDIMIITVGACN